MEHLNPFRLDAHFFEQLLGLLNLLLGSEISFQEMTIAFLSASHEDSVSAIFKRLEQMEGIHRAGAHQLDDAHVRGILQAHGTGEVSSRIGAIGTAEPDYLRLIFSGHVNSFPLTPGQNRRLGRYLFIFIVL